MVTESCCVMLRVRKVLLALTDAITPRRPEPMSNTEPPLISPEKLAGSWLFRWSSEVEALLSVAACAAEMLPVPVGAFLMKLGTLRVPSSKPIQSASPP